MNNNDNGFHRSQRKYDLQKYHQVISDVLATSADAELVKMLNSNGDRRVMYLLVGMFVPVREGVFSELLKELLAEERGGEVYLSEDVQREICKLVVVLLKRADQAVMAKSYTESRTIAEAIVQGLNAELSSTLGDGKDFKVLLAEALALLGKLDRMN